jgi:hypothetical protein
MTSAIHFKKLKCYCHSFCEFYPSNRDAVHRAYTHALPTSNAAGVIDHNRIDLGPMGGFHKTGDGACFIGFHFFDQLDAIPGSDVDAVPAVDAASDVDFVMKITEVAALRLLLRLL